MTSSATASATTTTSPDVRRGVVAGVTGSLVGGVVFGLMMQTQGMMPMLAALVGGDSVVLGWVVHLGISAVLGAGFGLVASRWLGSYGRGVGVGLGYGLVWWVLGALLLMPARLSMPTFQLNDMTYQSLMGHLVWGAILGVVSVAMVRRSAAS